MTHEERDEQVRRLADAIAWAVAPGYSPKGVAESLIAEGWTKPAPTGAGEPRLASLWVVVPKDGYREVRGLGSKTREAAEQYRLGRLAVPDEWEVVEYVPLVSLAAGAEAEDRAAVEAYGNACEAFGQALAASEMTRGEAAEAGLKAERAADALLARIAQVRANRDLWQEQALAGTALLAEVIQKREAAEAEVQRLTAALREARDTATEAEKSAKEMAESLQHIKQKAWGSAAMISGFRKWVAERADAALRRAEPGSA